MKNKEELLHKNPFLGFNNRKRTLGVLRTNARIQSIPIFKSDKTDFSMKFLGWKYIDHGNRDFARTNKKLP